MFGEERVNLDVRKFTRVCSLFVSFKYIQLKKLSVSFSIIELQQKYIKNYDTIGMKGNIYRLKTAKLLQLTT